PFSEDHVADRPISPYAATKRAGELLVHTSAHLYGLTAVCLRFFTVYGPRQRPDLAIHKFARLMSRGEEVPMYGDGTSERDYTYIDDILDGIEGALAWADAHPGHYEVVNLGGARPIALPTMVDELDRTLDGEPGIRRRAPVRLPPRHTVPRGNPALRGVVPRRSRRAARRGPHARRRGGAAGWGGRRGPVPLRAPDPRITRDEAMNTSNIRPRRTRGL